MRLETESDFIKLLHGLFEYGGYGFPIGSILTDYKISDDLRADIVIALDEPLGIIEVKKGKFDLISSTKQLKSYYKEIDNKNVELFLVCFGPIDDPKKTKFYQYDKKNDKLEEIKRLPNYEYFLNKRKRELRLKLFKSIDWFKYISLLGIFFIVFGIYSILNDISISTAQFFVLLLGVGIIVLPFFTKIKILGLELEMKSKK